LIDSPENDQMHDIVNDITISNLFTKKPHHKI
jgi:hypothetical protein